MELVDEVPQWLKRKPEAYRTALREAHALTLSLGPDTIVSGAPAVVLMNDPAVFRGADANWRTRLTHGSLTAYVPRHQTTRLSGVTVIRAPHHGQVHTRGGVRLATSTVAIIDEVALLYREEMEAERRARSAQSESRGRKEPYLERTTALVDFVLQRRLLNHQAMTRHIEDLEAIAARGPSVRRLQVPRWVAKRAAEGTQSHAERECADLLRSHGFRAGKRRGWRANHEVALTLWDGREQRYRLDFAWPEAKVAVEVDGREFHTGSDAFESDRERLRHLTAAGWKVLPVTWSVLTRTPASFLSELHSLLGQSPVHPRSCYETTQI